MSGHIFDMINRINQNKISKRRKFKGNNHQNMYSGKLDTSTTYDFQTASAAELENIRQILKEESKKQQRNSYYLLAICIIFAAMAVWSFLQYF